MKCSARMAMGMICATVLGMVGSGAKAQYLYVGDIFNNEVHRFDATTGAPVAPNPFITSSYVMSEGLACTNSVLYGTSGYNSIRKFDKATGADLGVLTSGFSGVGNIALSSNGQYIYAADESASRLYRVRTTDGGIDASVPLAGVHDVTFGSDGFVYAAGYNAATGVHRYNPDLTGGTTFIANGDNGLTRPTGMTFANDGTFYVMQNTFNTPGSVYHYTGAGAFLGAVSDPNLTFAFDSEIGPDGNLYIVSLGSYFNGSYVNCIVKYDTTTNTDLGAFGPCSSLAAALASDEFAAQKLRTGRDRNATSGVGEECKE